MNQPSNLTLNDYQDAVCAASHQQFHILLLCLVGRACTAFNAYSNYARDGGVFPQVELAKSLADVLWHVAGTADRLGMDLSDIAGINLEAIAARDVTPGASNGQ